ncbi:MAG: THUMP domain-containing class I SAM-dependent RNA methyltransferase [Janthinobacterium lividum]
MSSFEFFAPCPRGLEAPLAAELRAVAAAAGSAVMQVGAEAPGGVHFRGSWAAAFAANLHSRIASRVLLKITVGGYRDERDIFALALGQAWEQWFSARQTLRVDVTAVKSPLKSLEFTTLRIKDAICDRLREKTGSRPDIDTAAPDVRVFAFVTVNQCTLYLDTSGEPLFKRGWRLDKGAAPLRENLAAGILRLSGWEPGMTLYDPMCGSGTFIAEAAQAALGIPPGSERRFAFEKIRGYDVGTWQTMKAEAMDARRRAKGSRAHLGIYGSDISGDMLVKARANFERAGLPMLPLKQVDARSMTPPSDTPGILIANPPYGERIEVRGRNARGELIERDDDGRGAGRGADRDGGGRGAHGGGRGPRGGGRGDAEGGYREARTNGEDDAAGFQRARPEAGEEVDPEFFRLLGDSLKQRFVGWRAFVLTSDRGLPGLMRLRESQKTPLFNGALECRLFRFDMQAGSLKPREGKPASEPRDE